MEQTTRPHVSTYIVHRTGATVDYSNALSILTRYFDSKPGRRTSFVVPIFRFVHTSNGLVRCALLLPPIVPAALRCYMSSFVSDIDLAKNLAALECVMKMHLCGLLCDRLERLPYNRSLKPVSPIDTVDSPIDEVDADGIINLKYVPDALSFPCVAIDDIGKFRLHLYSIEAICEPIPQGFHVSVKSKHIITSINTCIIGLPSLYPSNDAFDLRIKEGLRLQAQLIYIGSHWFSTEELIQVQRYHQAVLAWSCEIDETSNLLSFEEWSRSSRGACYYIMPGAGIARKNIQVPPYTQFKCPSNWVTSLKSAADSAQFMIRRLTVHRDKLKGLSTVSPVVVPITSMKGKLLSHNLGFFCAEVEEANAMKLSNRIPGISTTFYEYYCRKGNLSIDLLTTLRNNPSHKLVSAIGISAKFTMENLISSRAEDLPVSSQSSSRLHVLPEVCEEIGNLSDYFSGLGLPSVVWRMQSIFLADECIGCIRDLFKSQYPDCMMYDNIVVPSPSEALIAMTPLMALENIDSERYEMLGDSVFKFLIGKVLFDIYPSKHEGQLTRLRSAIISNELQAKRAEATGISQYLRAMALVTGKGLVRFPPPGVLPHTLLNTSLDGPAASAITESVEKEESSDSPTINSKCKRLADLVEALVGVYYLSGGIPAAEYVLKALGFWPSLPPTTNQSADHVGQLGKLASLQDTFSDLSDDNATSEQVRLELSARNDSSYLDCVDNDTYDLNKLCIPEGFPEELCTLAAYPDGHYANDVFKSAAPQLGSTIATSDSISLSQLEDRLGYHFIDRSFLTLALTHPSVVSAAQNKHSYERLEFLGDAVLDLAVVHLLHQSLKQTMDPGKLSHMKSKYTNNLHLGNVAIQLHLFRSVDVMSAELTDAFKLINLAMEAGERVEFDPESSVNVVSHAALDVMADCLEALIGAVFLDCKGDLSAIWLVVEHIGLIHDQVF